MMSDTEEQTQFSRGYDTGQSDLYDWLYETTEEWYSLRVVDDRQYIALQMLVHELEKKVFYERRVF